MDASRRWEVIASPASAMATRRVHHSVRGWCGEAAHFHSSTILFGWVRSACSDLQATAAKILPQTRSEALKVECNEGARLGVHAAFPRWPPDGYNPSRRFTGVSFIGACSSGIVMRNSRQEVTRGPITTDTICRCGADGDYFVRDRDGNGLKISGESLTAGRRIRYLVQDR